MGWEQYLSSAFSLFWNHYWRRSMEYRHLGKSGIRVSALSLGSWVTFYNQVDVRMAIDAMAAAYDAGVNFFDNAESYAHGKSEEVMGQAIKKLGWRRSSFIVSSKFYWGLNDGINERNTLNRKYLMQAVEGSLKRFDLEYLDLVFCHRPDPETPVKRRSGRCITSLNGARRFTGVPPCGPQAR
jgi:Predicted oxidoreductases (related to aryl-alcohol dehydrogenases)